jgi:hypothetical protein
VPREHHRAAYTGTPAHCNVDKMVCTPCVARAWVFKCKGRIDARELGLCCSVCGIEHHASTPAVPASDSASDPRAPDSTLALSAHHDHGVYNSTRNLPPSSSAPARVSPFSIPPTHYGTQSSRSPSSLSPHSHFYRLLRRPSRRGSCAVRTHAFSYSRIHDFTVVLWSLN